MTTWIRITVQTWESDSDEDITQVSRAYTLEQLQGMGIADRMIGNEVIQLIDNLLPGEAPKP